MAQKKTRWEEQKTKCVKAGQLPTEGKGEEEEIMNKKPVFDLAPVDSEKKTTGVPEEDENEGNESSNNNRDGPTQQNIKNLRRAQILYRDMKRTREDLKSRKERLNWEIRFGPTNGVTKEEIMELEKERTYVM